MDCETIKTFSTLIAGLLAGLVAVLLYFLKRKDDEINLIKNKISDEKYKAYFDIVSLFFDLMKQSKGVMKFKQNELEIRYIDLKKNILLLGSDEIFRKFNEFDKNIVEYENNPDISKIDFWLQLFILIRKDCGNPKTKVNIDDILRSIMATDKDYYEIKNLIENKYKY